MALMGRRKQHADRAPEAKSSAGAPAGLLPKSPVPPLLRWLVAAAIAAAAVAAYWNTLDCGFVNWDDKPYILENPLVTGDGGLAAIWTDGFRQHPTRQYYPLVWTTYWIEHRLARDLPRVIHATQLALHAATAATVWFMLLWLGAPPLAAATAALLFALHPINVASVAWMAERKNTLSGLCFWLSLTAYLQFRRGGNTWRYVVSLVLFQLALFAKTASVVMVPILLLTDRVLAGRWQARSLLRALPFALLSLVMGAITVRVESLHAKSGEPIAILLRPLVTCAALVHEIAKTFWPLHLVGVYPRWPESLAWPRYWLSAGIVLAVCLLLWRFRRSIPPLVWWGVGVFVLGQALTLGFIHFNYLQFSFVADHFLYLASVGLFQLVGLAVDWLARGRRDAPAALRTPRCWVVATGTAAVLATLGVLTIRQNRVWSGTETFWRHTLAANPDCYSGNLNLGNHYFAARNYSAALPLYLEAVRIDPTMIITHRSVARTAAALGRTDEAIVYYRSGIEAQQRKQPKGVGMRLELADYLKGLGRLEEALREYNAALDMRPNHPEATRAAADVRRQLGSNPANYGDGASGTGGR
jgi:hypothetical protein